MDTLGLKLILTPFLIGLASLAGRRYGAAVVGSFAFAVFFLVVAGTLERAGTPAAFAGATLAALLVQGALLLCI